MIDNILHHHEYTVAPTITGPVYRALAGFYPSNIDIRHCGESVQRKFLSAINERSWECQLAFCEPASTSERELRKLHKGLQKTQVPVGFKLTQRTPPLMVFHSTRAKHKQMPYCLLPNSRVTIASGHHIFTNKILPQIFTAPTIHATKLQSPTLPDPFCQRTEAYCRDCLLVQGRSPEAIKHPF